MYEWLKVLHIISLISWFAGLFYLPRLFVYHVENINKDESVEIFKKMEHKLLKVIMNPAMIATWIFGLSLVHYVGLSKWLILKIFFVVLLSIYHMYLSRIRKNLESGINKYSSKFLRYLNEVPTILLIIIVILVVIKPF
ncbi:MAG: protoporphyrinogen oxidase HemJ [Alphaproteobacteria bacterium]|jgi:protoporphyrinogen IX oxidase|nr:protoporphyrinogen oxidase HemJ [Alphaproteobacteria bacterium]|tara:strand:+ start:549 stop:965 length:417 start_codon:yes stop_codon:yes gene_type:complete